MAGQARLRSSTARRSTPPRKRNATASRRGKPWRLLRGTETAPVRVACRGRSCRNSGRVGALGGRSSSRGFLHSGMRLAAISFGLRQPFRRWLRIADGLGQHLAKLGLGLWRFAREAFCPYGHEQYVGMQEGELKPCREGLHVGCCAHNRLNSDMARCPKSAINGHASSILCSRLRPAC